MKCSARRTDGEPCQAWSIRGALVCRVHGGSAPQTRAAAARRLAEADAATQCQVLGIPTEVDPRRALVEEVWRCAGRVAWLEGLIRSGGATLVADGRLSPHATLLGESQDRLVRAAQAAVRVDADAVERTVRAVVDVLDATIDDPELGLTARQRSILSHGIARRLRELTEVAA